MRYLLDTNILIYLMNNKSVALVEKMQQFDTEAFGVSVITQAELFFGAKKSAHIERNLQAAIKILSPFISLAFNSEDAMEYAEIRSHLERHGQVIGANDMLIAAQARRKALTLVTANTREFERVPHFKVENWCI